MILHYTCYFDLHVGSTNEACSLKEFRDSIQENRERGDIIVYGGDNIDLANCKHTEVKRYSEAIKDIIRRGVAVFVPGNHERCESVGERHPKYIHVENMVFSHGDFEFWGMKKALNYRNKRRGAGLFKRGIVVNIIELFEDLFESRINTAFKARANQLMLLTGAKYYICGHKHPKNNIIIKTQVGTIIILKRGINRLEYNTSTRTIEVLG